MLLLVGSVMEGTLFHPRGIPPASALAQLDEEKDDLMAAVSTLRPVQLSQAPYRNCRLVLALDCLL